MGKYDNLRNQLNSSTNKVQTGISKLSAVNTEMRRVADVAHSAESIINDIDEQFAKATKLDKTDIIFLFAATALQCARWILFQSLDLKKDDLSQKSLNSATNEQQKSFLNEQEQNLIVSNSLGYFGWNEILGAPVPYENLPYIALNNSINTDSTIPLGNDPILGWIFGTMGIMSRTTIMKDFSCYNVDMYDRTLQSNGIFFKDNRQIVTTPTNISTVMGICLQSFAEDNKRLFAAVARQGIHMVANSSSLIGLPPLSLSSSKAQNLLERGWDTSTAETALKKFGKNIAIIGAQAGLSILINFIVKSVHFLFFDDDPADKMALDLYEVKTRKILSYSNAIASGSNILYCAISQNYSKLDIGGILVTIYRLITDYKFIKSIKKEFLEKQWYNEVMGDFNEFDYLQEGKYE